MKTSQFAKNTILILLSKIIVLVLGMLSSMLLARSLGPEGKGVYSLSVLFASLLMTFSNLGLGPATIHYVAKRQYPLRVVLGSNAIISLGLGLLSSILGLILLFVFQTGIFPKVPRIYLLLVLTLVPLDLFRQQAGVTILLGAEKIKQYNIANAGYAFLLLVFLFIGLKLMSAGVIGALGANILSSLVIFILLFGWLTKMAGGMSLRIHKAYSSKAIRYGIQAYLGNLIGFLNYRIELFILGAFLPISAVGFYSIAVGLAEKLWLVSQSAATLIFPIVSAEQDEERRKQFTPLVVRTVFLITMLGAIFLFVLANWFIPMLYSGDYLPSVKLFRILLPGIVFLSAARIMANDIAGRGKPILNTYVGGISLFVQFGFNILLIPRFGVEGSAWASTLAYAVILFVRTFLYMRLSENSLRQIVLPQGRDWELYKQLASRGWQSLKMQTALIWPQR